MESGRKYAVKKIHKHYVLERVTICIEFNRNITEGVFLKKIPASINSLVRTSSARKNSIGG